MIQAFIQKRQVVEQRLRQLERQLDSLNQEKQQLQSGDITPITSSI